MTTSDIDAEVEQSCEARVPSKRGRLHYNNTVDVQVQTLHWLVMACECRERTVKAQSGAAERRAQYVQIPRDHSKLYLHLLCAVIRR